MKIMVTIVAAVLAVVVLVGGSGLIIAWTSTVSTLEKSLMETVEQSAAFVSGKLDNYKLMSQTLGCTARLANPTASNESKAAICNERKQMYNAKDIFISDAAGKAVSYITGKTEDISSQDYFKQAVGGDLVVTSPMVTSLTGEMDVLSVSPLWEEGVNGTKILGTVVMVFSSEEFCSWVRMIDVGDTGSSFVVDSGATTIAHNDIERVTNRENIIELSKQKPELNVLAEMEHKMINAETGFLSYSFGGVKKIASYAPIQGSNGWSIAVTAEEKEFMQGAYSGGIIMLLISAGMIVIAIIITPFVAKTISEPIKKCAQRLELLAEGDLHSSVPAVSTKDETALLLNATSTTIKKLNHAIEGVTLNLDKISHGDISSEVVTDCQGDLAPLAESISQIYKSLNDFFVQARRSSEQTALGSAHVSVGAQTLSQGTVEQASELENLSLTVDKLLEQVKENAGHAQTANEVSLSSGEDISLGNEQMKEMLSAMNEISDCSSKIANIIKTIEDIAFQTNILALNAAVEAARAGEAGKGFAVVADEVRNLASKSSEAAKDTTALIEASVRSVENGIYIANETAGSLTRIVENSSRISELVGNITSASVSQAKALGEVTSGISQISGVVQTNSATAEESAAASEELAAQAKLLSELVSHFKIDEKYENSFH